MEKKRFLECGKITGTHGIKGEVKIDPWCDSPEFLLDVETVYSGGVPYKLSSARVHKKMVIARFDGVSDIDGAMALKNKVLCIDRNDVELDEGAWFIQDIIGLPVFNESGAELGVLSEVLYLPSSDVYVVRGGEREHMIPAVPEFLKSVDMESGRIVVSLIEGM